ncbi:MAG TPA: hypothetical protein VK338_01310 [Candidatus Nitrosocosmicus sp.]|nr:hypothetical protein [Candidatus Nitrosocosmicus sp.]
MIYIVLGDDTVRSRQEYLRLKKEYEDKDYEIHQLTLDSLNNLHNWLGESQDLFHSKKVFFGEQLLSKKENREKLKEYDTRDGDIDIVIWEEKMEERVAQFLFTNAKLIVQKLPVSIFKLLDSLYPSNLKQVNGYLTELGKSIDENILFFMIAKRIRELILIKYNVTSSKKAAAWQIERLRSQANNWDESKLLKFYDSLHRIDVQNKTSKNYYSLKDALDILFCYYVR